MTRAYLYLGASGVIWLIEGFLFSYYLRFAGWQVALIAGLYLGLYGTALRYFLRAMRGYQEQAGMAAWRAVSVAPMVVVVLGSFASLPLVVAVAALGKLI